MNYTEMESKVREATNDEAWGPTGQLMQELAQATFSYEHFPEVMSMLWRRMLIDNQSNWRRTYKSLIVLNYIVKNGAERAVTSAREHIYDLKTLENYTYIDETGKDCGQNVRLRVKQLIEFIQNDDALRDERKKAKKNKDKYVGVASDGFSYGSSGVKFNSAFSDIARYDDDSEFASREKSKTSVANETKGSLNTNSDEGASSVRKASNDLIETQTCNSKGPKDINIMDQPTRKSASPPFVDLLSDLSEAGAHSDPVEPKPQRATTKQGGATSNGNSEADLKEIVKNIDIFSNKKPRPTKSNKSNIPDLTLKNPNTSFAASRNRNPLESSSVSQESVPRDTGERSNDVDKAILFETVQSVHVDEKSHNQSQIDEFDLLNINPVPSKPASIVQPNESLKPSKNLDEISSLNLINDDDPFGLNQVPTSPSKAPVKLADVAAKSPLSPEDLFMPSGIFDSNPVKPQSSRRSELPESWNNLVAGTKFSIDLDNLLKPNSGKGVSPSLNELAKVKPNNDDLFG